ncbi:MAG: MFS transporter [Holophaga sp.]|nr:MFS transporter [Holophaga sp.]
MEPTAATIPISASKAWYSDLQPQHYRVLAASFLGWVFDGYESYVLVLVVPFVLKAMLTPGQMTNRAIYAGMTFSVTLLGWGIGGMTGGIMADYIGRKRMMMLSILFYALFTGFTALATNFWMFCFLRLITGFAMGSEWSTGVALLSETWPNKARPKGAGFLQSGFGVGTLLAALVWLVLSKYQPLGANTWRLVFVVGALPALFCLYIRRAVGESEKWLKAVREQRWGKTNADGTVSVGSSKRPFTLSEIFREPESRKNVLLTFLLSITTTVGWYAISIWLPDFAVQMAKNLGLANATAWGLRSALVYTSGAVVGYLLSGFLADGVGRRKFLFITFLGSLLITAYTYLGIHSMGVLMAASLVNGAFTLGFAYSWMAIYPVELFNSSVRSTAASFIFNGARLVAFVFPFLSGTIVKSFGSISRAAITMSMIYLIGLVVPWFLPETNGKPLPE